MRALSLRPSFDVKLIHTGQHYDAKLSQVFFDQLAIPRPDLDLEVGSSSHAVQTAEIMQRFEAVLLEENPHCVVVVGDVNSTTACALVTSKYHLPEPFLYRGNPRTRPVMVHVEAGLRSFDDDMPEETNRRVTDILSDILFVSDPSGLENLASEGVDPERVEYVGNVMIDTLLFARDKAMGSSVLDDLGLTDGEYGLVTLHRPSNVDDESQLRHLVGVLDDIARPGRAVGLPRAPTHARPSG
jgi:UDP-N-acetylglucosamine 2-epimerase (non-hydrolysing)